MPDKPSNSHSRLVNFWTKHLRPMLVVLIVLFTFRSSVADWNDVPTPSMEPTILVGERILVNKLAYDLKLPFTTRHIASWSDPSRGDIVVFYAPHNGTRMVKRVIGVPGDRIRLESNQLFINDVAQPLAAADQRAIGATDLTDPGPFAFAFESLDGDRHELMFQPARRAARSFREIVVPPDQYLVMGDNRDNSGDSRVFGFVPRDEIVGRAFGVAVSLDTDGGYAPRWKRFFRGLD